MTPRTKEISRILFFLVLGLLVSTSVLGLACKAVMIWHFAPKQRQGFESFDAIVKERFLGDLKRLKENPLFSASQYTSNVQPYIEKFIPLHGPEKELGDSQLVRKLFEDCKIQDDQPLFQKVMDHPHFSKINTGWMEELEKYDHWSIYSKPSIKRAIIRAGNSGFLEKINLHSQLPIPDFKLFLDFAYLHFLKTKDQNLRKAYETYWHHLFLLHTNGGLVSSILVSSGLKRGYELQQVFPEKTTPLFDLKVAASYKRVSWGWIGVINNVWEQDMDPTLMEYFQPEMGICSAASEHFGNLMFSDLLVDSYWPFEPNYEQEKARSKAIQMRLMKVCHFHELTAFIDRNFIDETSLSQENVDEDDPLAIPDLEISKPAQGTLSIPYLRRVYWGIISSISSPGFFRVYEDERFLKEEKD